MAIYKLGVFHPRLEFVGVEIFTTFCFLWRNLVSDMLESQSRDLKTRMII